jgi:hypothetical protein
MRRTLVILACVAALGALVGTTLSAFSDEAANSGNSFEAATSFGGNLRMAAGTYTGNGSDNRSIDAGFQPDLVIVKASTTQIGWARTSTMSGDSSKPLTGATALATNRIQSFASNGFVVGTDGAVNTSGTTYYWQAFKADSAVLKLGSYTGNGASARGITGVGFTPEYVAVLSAGGQRANQRYAGMTRGFQFDADTGQTNRVSSLDADGFTVGNNDDANRNGTVYHYVAFNETSGSVKQGSYAGNGSSRSVTGVGFSPLYAMVRANDTGTGRQGHHRSAAVPGSGSQFFTNQANVTNGISSLLSDGFGVGSNAAVNANGPTYHYLAVRNSGGGCSTPGTQTLTTNADAWVDQASPSTNKGNDSVLKVTSKSGNANTRALVAYSLPSVPEGCSVTSARLRLYNSSPVGGRTLEAVPNSASWTENGVTWSNQPGTTGSAATATTPSNAAWMEWTVTSQVQSMYSGANHGFKIRDAVEDSAASPQQSINSRETGSNPPELVVTFG